MIICLKKFKGRIYGVLILFIHHMCPKNCKIRPSDVRSKSQWLDSWCEVQWSRDIGYEAYKPSDSYDKSQVRMRFSSGLYVTAK